jgi:hypothetical protein
MSDEHGDTGAGAVTVDDVSDEQVVLETTFRPTGTDLRRRVRYLAHPGEAKRLERVKETETEMGHWEPSGSETVTALAVEMGNEEGQADE